MNSVELRTALDQVIANSDLPHVERLTLSAAIISEALRLEALEATLVGGAAIEFYAPGSYVTGDIDLVVERRHHVAQLERALGRAFTALGFHRAGRHWTRDDIFVEVPGTRDSTSSVRVPSTPTRPCRSWPPAASRSTKGRCRHNSSACTSHVRRSRCDVTP